MCGIVGVWNIDKKPMEWEVVNAFNNTLTHRGPDGSDIFIDKSEQLGLGHRRLSILDLSELGMQPMTDASEKFVITYNGEIFNYIELRDELRKLGHHFISSCDTEVILAAYKEWGEECLQRFNGMWAFAIWNTEKKSLFISRDRYGIKPLYYVYIPGQYFAFASESIAFGKLDRFKKSLNDKNLNLGIRYSFYLESVGETIYDHIKKLKPGHNLKLGVDSKPVIKKWWHTERNLVSIPDNYNEQIEQFRDLLLDSCKIRLRSDVAIATALSGGLDSSSIYSTIRHLAKTKLFDGINTPADWQTAFIATFPGTTMDEKEYADEVVKYHNCTAVHILPDQNLLPDAISNQVIAEDFIYMSPPVVHTIYKEMRKYGIKVSLDGHGADEMLFGYPDMIVELLNSGENIKTDKGSLNILAGLLNMPVAEIKKTYQFGNLQQRSSLQKLYDDSVPFSLKKVYRKQIFNKNRHLSWMNEYVEPEECSVYKASDSSFNIPYEKFHGGMLPTFLRNWDRASMQHGVEIRMPFMDCRLVSYVFSLPVASKLGDGFTKKILRDAMKGWMPENIRTRKQKIGINAPMIEWFNGPLSAFIQDAVSSQSFVKSAIWNGPLLKAYALDKVAHKSWDHQSTNGFWPYLNAWILSNKKH